MVWLQLPGICMMSQVLKNRECLKILDNLPGCTVTLVPVKGVTQREGLLCNPNA